MRSVLEVGYTSVDDFKVGCQGRFRLVKESGRSEQRPLALVDVVQSGAIGSTASMYCMQCMQAGRILRNRDGSDGERMQEKRLRLVQT